MFVQGPRMVHEKSDNSEDVSDEEGSGDVLQVDIFCKLYPLKNRSIPLKY